jgi:hypothetical protein
VVVAAAASDGRRREHWRPPGPARCGLLADLINVVSYLSYAALPARRAGGVVEREGSERAGRALE